MTTDEKIADCQRQLANPKISPCRKRDLTKWLRRLEKEKHHEKSVLQMP